MPDTAPPQLPQPPTRGLPALAVVAAALVAAAAVAADDAAVAELHWHDRLDAALAAAERTDRPVLIDLYADWCGLCHKLEREVLSSAAFRDYAAERFVFLRVDIDDGGEGSRLRDRFASSLPTVVVVDARMAPVGVVRGYQPTPVMIRRLEISLLKHRELEAAYARLLHEDDPGRMLPFAETLIRRGDGARAATLYRRLIAHGYDVPGGEIRLRFRLAEALRLAGDLDAAEKQVELLRHYRRVAVDEDLCEALTLLELEIARDRSDCPAATAVVEEFLAEHPTSRRTGEALATLRRIETDPRAECQ